MGTTNEPVGRGPRAWVHALTALGLAAVAAAVYAPAAGFEFIGFDDWQYVSDNPKVLRGLTWDGIDWAFTEVTFPITGNWHPLTWLSLQVDAAVWGKDPTGYHLTNVLFHAANAALVYLALRRLTGAAGRSAAVALLWAVHPQHAESVVWVSERKDVLFLFFGLLGLWTYAGYAAAPTDRRMAVVFALLGLGLMAKSMLVTFPFLLLLLDYWPLRRAATARDWVPLVREKLPLFLVVMAACLITMYTQQRAGAVGRDAEGGLSNRISDSAVAYVTYLSKTAYPSGLCVLHPRPLEPEPGWTPAAVGSAAALVVVTAGAWAVRRRCPYLLFGWLWFLGSMVPVIGLVQIGGHVYADRYVYLPHIGLFVAAVWAGADLLGRLPRPTTARAAVVVATAVVLVVATRSLLPHWQNNRALWLRAVAVHPDHPFPWLLLSGSYQAEGRTEDALRCLDECDRIAPGYYPSRFARLEMLGQLDQ